METPKELSGLIKNKAYELGFQHCGIAEAGPMDDHRTRLIDWLGDSCHAGMAYMSRNIEKRLDPCILVNGARSLIIVALNYYQDYDPGDEQPVFSRYALGKDYHKVVKDKLYLLYDTIREKVPTVEGRVFVDSAPVLERAWAVKAGLGWIGKNSMLINRRTGSFTFLGTLIINQELVYDEPSVKDYCGSCTKCVDACPVNAIRPGRTIDANRCLAYLNVEHKGNFENSETKLHNRVFGCDICQDVCPWNRRVIGTEEKSFQIIEEIKTYSRSDWERCDEESFNSIFIESPLRRASYNGFKRNLGSL